MAFGILYMYYIPEYMFNTRVTVAKSLFQCYRYLRMEYPRKFRWLTLHDTFLMECYRPTAAQLHLQENLAKLCEVLE